MGAGQVGPGEERGHRDAGCPGHPAAMQFRVLRQMLGVTAPEGPVRVCEAQRARSSQKGWLVR